MSHTNELELKNFLLGTTQSGDLAEMIEKPGSLEAAGVTGSLTRQTLEKLARDQRLNDRERFHLEAIIIPERRPAIDIIDGSFETRHQDWLHLNAAPVRDRLRQAFPSIGRLELPGHPSVPYGGTAFIVGDGLLMTNRHVAELFCEGIGTSGLRFITGVESGVDFLRERRSTRQEYIRITSVVLIHPYWDVAIVRVEGLRQSRRPLRLSTEPGANLLEREVALVGFPAYDPRNPADVQNFVFDGVYGIKRLQPGVLKTLAPVESYRHEVEALTHDSSTLGGNSGSCVLDLKSGDVLGVHFGGNYGKANFCVAAGDLARDGRVIDTGVRFSGPVQRSDVPWETYWQATETTVPAAVPDKSSSPLPDRTSAMAQQTGEIRLSIPLEITIRVGDGVTTAAAGASSVAGGTERALEPFHDTDYSTRTGYDPHFLGPEVPLPTPRKPEDLARVDDGGHLLHYHHFSLAVHKKRRLALFTAANVDASAAAKRPGNRPDADYTRDGLGKLGPNDQEKWFSDQRILATEQLPDKFFTKDKGAFDKGHIVRRDDVAWGRTYEEMQNANGDTFHVTNCSPQVLGFNRSSRGKDNWGDLENLILGQADTEKLVVFGGPVLADTDPVFLGVDLEGDIRVRIPEKYWKVVVAEKNGQLESFAFLLEQDLSEVPLEFAVPQKWKRFLKPVHVIEDLAQIDFHETIRRADQSGTNEAVAFAKAAGVTPLGGSGEAAGNAGNQAAGIDIGDIVADWRKLQSERRSFEDFDIVRLVVSLGKSMTDQTIKAEVEDLLGLTVDVAGLFDSDPDLDRYRAIDIPGVVWDDRADLFDVARAIRTRLEAETVEPDLDTRYYDSDGGGPATEGSAEGANVAFWCWVDENDPGIKPDDADWAVNKTGVPKAWAFSSQKGKPAKGRGIRVFQPDTGVVPAHTEMPPRVADNPRSANFVEPGQRPVDPMRGSGNLGHGTATGSVVASPEAGRVRGTAPEAELVPVRCIRSVAVFNQSRVAQAIDHARRNDAHVITMSLGGVPSWALHSAVRKAVKANIIVVAAAGNCVETVVWPARYDEVIAVGGINFKDLPWKGSCSGRSVDISGPAELVLRADARDGADLSKVGGGQGTSFATAHLAGIAACWLAHHGRDALIAKLRLGKTLQDLFKAMIASTARVPAGFDTDNYGAGIIDAEALVKRDPATLLGLETIAERTRTSGELVAELLLEVAGSGGVESAAPVLQDKQSELELACVGLDASRVRKRASRSLEAQPPMRVSSGLKTMLQGDVLDLIRSGGVR